jgi:hypothetical protein
MTAVWGHCTLHTRETIEFGRGDPVSENNKGNKNAEGK